MNIDLDNIKVVIFDFDDTLAIHRDRDFLKHRNESEDKRLSYYLDAYENPDTFYEEIEPCDRSENVYNFMSMFGTNGNVCRFGFKLVIRKNISFDHWFC